MPKQPLPAYLIDREGKKRCSVCSMPFVSTDEKSLSRAFSDHVRTAHKAGQKKEDTSQGAARIVKEATK